MNFTVSAKPLEWKETEQGEQWDDSQFGFSITYSADDSEEHQYHYAYYASWGEGPSDSFTTLEEAKQWCQDEADALVRKWAQVIPSAADDNGGS